MQPIASHISSKLTVAYPAWVSATSARKEFIPVGAGLAHFERHLPLDGVRVCSECAATPRSQLRRAATRRMPTALCARQSPHFNDVGGIKDATDESGNVGLTIAMHMFVFHGFKKGDENRTIDTKPATHRTTANRAVVWTGD